jgi:hypothetical protein
MVSNLNYLCGSLSFYNLKPLRVVEAKLFSANPIPPRLVVQRDDVQGRVAQLLNFRIPIVHQVDLE